MKPALYKKNKFWLALSLVLVLLSAIGASLVQTSAYTITVKDMSWETSTGESLSALLYKPNGVTADNPAPAIVVSHGWWNNKEMQDANFVELARRGYVVVSIDMYGHGDSDYLTNSDITAGGTGMYDAVKLVADLPYVQQDKIGVSGHSNGARAANFSIPLDDAADEQLIAAVLLVDNDAVYTDADGAYTNVYGSRDVGISAAQYDEFFFRSYSPEGAVLTPPREYIGTPNAQSFLNFGAEGTETREAGTFYEDTVDGDDAFRVIYNPAESHPWSTISKTTVASQVEFFEEAFGAPNPIASGSQIWQVKEAFTTLGIVGFWIFVLAFARAMLHTRAFAGLRVVEPRPIAANSRKGLIWFWGGLVVLAFVSGASWVLMSQTPWIQGIAFNVTPTIFTQGAVFFVALWALINAVAVAIVLAVSYFAYGRKNGLDLRAAGLLPGWRKFFHGIGLAAVVVAASFSLVFIVDYFFKTDFRFWTIAIKAFGPDKLWIALLYVPFFLAYFVASSVAVNAFNRFTIRGKEWGNTAAIALFTALAAIVLVIVQYMTFFITGQTITGFGGIFSIWLFPVILILILTVIISRKLYRVTGNPYIAGFINAAIVTIISVTNTLTVTY